MKKNRKYLEVGAVARRLYVSPMTVYRLIDSGVLHGGNFGVSKGKRVLLSSVEDFERKRTFGDEF
jgi:hypothetical protein